MMQSLWPRAQLQAYACRCGSCLKRCASDVASTRTAPSASRRWMLIGNSVTGFYATIFATAVAWDTSVKTRKRLETQKEIEAMKAEVALLERDQLRRLEALTSRRKSRTSTISHQRRNYSTFAKPSRLQCGRRNLSVQAAEAQCRSLELESSKTLHVNEEVDCSAVPRAQPLPRELTDHDADVDPRSEAEIERFECDLSLNDILRQRAILRLAARQLAIKMILRPALAHLYAGVPFNSRSSCVLPDIEIETLLTELENIRIRIAKLKGSRDAWFGDLASNITIVEHQKLVAERNALNDDLKRMNTMYQDDELTSRDLLIKVAENILSSEEPLSRLSVSLMIRIFSRSRQNDVVNMIIDSIFPNGLILGEGVIIATLDFFNKSKDLYRFDGFLNRLLGGKLLRLPQYWQLITVGNIDIPVPPKGNDQVILSVLISSALGFNQPQRADAWLTIMRHRGYGDTAHVLGSYLRFYSQQQNWDKGRLLLVNVVKYIEATVADKEGQFERLILYMAAFCKSCGQEQLGNSIVEVAAAHGISWQDAYNSTDERIVILSTLERWRAASELPKLFVFKKSMSERHKAFAINIKATIQRAVGVGDSLIDLRNEGYDSAIEGAENSESTIRDHSFEMEILRHRQDLRNLHARLSRQTQGEEVREKVHSLELAIRDIALEVEKRTRKAEIASLKSQLDLIKTMLSHRALATESPNRLYTNDFANSKSSFSGIERQPNPQSVPRIKRFASVSKYPAYSARSQNASSFS